MAKTDFQSVEEYITSQPAESQRVLRRVRTILRGALPKAEESISYQIPTYKLNGRAVIYFAGWKKHYSLYPLGANVTEALAKELAPYEVEKDTVRFAFTERMPTHLIQRIAKLRAEATTKEAPVAATREISKKSKRKRTKATSAKTKVSAASKPRAKAPKQRVKAPPQKSRKVASR
jgi:uncharacterized protein YdhG (YjbR/CyaY superfamily)